MQTFPLRATTAPTIALAAALLAGCGGSPTSSAPASQPDPAPAPTHATLREAAATRGLDYGCAVGAGPLSRDTAFASLVRRECGVLVSEYDLKWENLRPRPDAFSFRAADEVVGFAERAGLEVRGHTLVWHHALPGWFDGHVTVGNAAAVLDEHIRTVVGRYAGRVRSWDVVNEAVETGHGRPDGLRQTPWLRLLGPGHIDQAFRAAAAADPAATLVYNEFGLEHANPAKRQAVLRLLRGMRERGVPIHALGIQAHLSAAEPIDRVGLREFLRAVSDLGLQILVTELDVSDAGLPVDPVVRDQVVAEQYASLLEVVLANDASVGVVTWGLSDRYSWLHSYRPRQDGERSRGLPLDEGLDRKPAYEALMRALVGAPARRG